MKITYVHYNEMPSSRANTVNVARMCGALADAGHDVTLICRRPAGFDPATFHAYYGLRANYAVIAPRIVARAPARLLFIVGLVHHWLSGGDLLYTRNILMADMSTALGVPTVLELHGPPSQVRGGRRRFMAAAGRAALRKVLLNSPGSLADAVQLAGSRAELCVLAPHGIDLAGGEIAIRERDGPLRACFAGSFYAGRGVEFLVSVAERAPEVAFHLVGAGPDEKARIEALLREKGIRNATISERVAPGKVAAILADSDVCLAPYQKAVFHEAGGAGPDYVAHMSPLKIFDYIGSGRPIVASDLPAISCIIEDGVSALLCDPEDADAWAKALARLAADPKLRLQLARSALDVVGRKYSWAARVDMALSEGGPV